MRFTLTFRWLAVVLAWALAGSGLAEADGPPAPFDPGSTVNLKVGESAPVGPDGLRVGFDAVVVDSRCPKDVQCVWAGDAVVRVWLQHGAGPRQSRDLHTGRAQTAAIDPPGYTVRLVQLDPVPIAGNAGTKPEYVATLTVVRGPAADPDR